MADYTQWPTDVQVTACLESAGIPLRSPQRVTPLLADVIAEVGRRTQRQFIADTADTTKTYNGNGTPELEVDEMVSLTGCVIVGYIASPGYTLANVVLIQEQNKPMTRIVAARGSLPALVEAGYIYPSPIVFPSGRQNIAVTGLFGYALEIPHDLWEAVNQETAHRLAKEAAYNFGGQVIERRAGDELEKYAPNAPKAIGWHDNFEAKVTFYTRPAGRRLRNTRNRMI